MVAFPPKDTVHLALPATSRHCNDGQSILLEAVSPEGSGVLLRLRYADSLITDSVLVVGPADTLMTPAATVAVRYFLRDAPHGVVLDSGQALVRRDRDQIGVRVEGSGLENAIRTPAQIEFHDVPLGTDTVACSSAP
jgi:hypothetical protein